MKRLLLILLLINIIKADDFSEATKLFDRKLYMKAFNSFYLLAKKKDIEAQYNLGFMYQQGLGVHTNIDKAKEWYQKAGEQGSVKAFYSLGWLYHNVEPKNYTEARYWYERAIGNDSIRAYNNLALLYMQGLGMEQNIKKALELFKKAKNKGSTIASLNLGIIYGFEDGIKHNKIQSFKYLKEALKNGESRAQEYIEKLCKESSWACRE